MDNMNKCWIFILIGGCFEIVWAVAMDYSEGFTKIPYDIIVIVGLAFSMFFLSKGMAGGLPIGTAYAVWVGIGAVGTIIVSAITGIETLTWIKALFIALIIAGIIGLQITSESKETE